MHLEGDMNIHLFHQMTFHTSLPQEIGTADFDTLAQQLYGIQGFWKMQTFNTSFF